MQGLMEVLTKAKLAGSPIPAVNKRLVPLREATQAELEDLVAKRDNLLPIEKEARKRLEHQIRCASVVLQFPHARLLDPQVLRWRWPNRPLRAAIFQVPVPKLVLVNIEDPKFFLQVRENNNRTTSLLPGGTDFVNRAYGDIIKRLNKATIFGERYTLSYTWEGIIPESGKKIIEHAVRFFGHYKDAYGRQSSPNVYLLTEAPHKEWTMKSEPIPRPPRHIDPLIVGHMGDDLFVVGAFDPTPLEQYVAMEFMTLPPGARGELPVSTS
jgi:hypothetical protein